MEINWIKPFRTRFYHKIHIKYQNIDIGNIHS